MRNYDHHFDLHFNLIDFNFDVDFDNEHACAHHLDDNVDILHCEHIEHVLLDDRLLDQLIHLYYDFVEHIDVESTEHEHIGHFLIDYAVYDGPCYIGNTYHLDADRGIVIGE